MGAENSVPIGKFTFDRDNVLGRGAYGTVYRGHVTDDPSVTVAIKEFKDEDSFYKELRIARGMLEALDKQCNPYILCLYAYVDDPSSPTKYIIYRMANMDLEMLMKRYGGGTINYSLAPKSGEVNLDYVRRIPSKTLYTVINTMVVVLEEMERLHISHRDIKQPNVLVYGRRQPHDIVLGDLGFLCRHEGASPKLEGIPPCFPSTPRGTLMFFPPTLVRTGYRRPEDIKWHDIFATGITLYYLLSGYVPMEPQGHNSVVLKNRPLQFPYNLRIGSTMIPRTVLNSLVNTMVYSTNYEEASKYKDIWAPYRNIYVGPTPRKPSPPKTATAAPRSSRRRRRAAPRRSRSRSRGTLPKKARKARRSKVRPTASRIRRRRSARR